MNNNNIIGLYAFKKEGEGANQIGQVAFSESPDYAFQLELKSGTKVEFNSLNEITFVEFGQ